MRAYTRFAAILAFGGLLPSCSALPRLDAVPPELTESAEIAGIPDARYWLDRDLRPFIESVIADTRREREALAQAGAKMSDVVRTRIFVRNIADWEQIGRAHGEVFGHIRPVCSMIQVSGLVSPDMLVEIEAEAIIAEE